MTAAAPVRPASRARVAISAAFFANGLAAGSWALLVPVLIRQLGVTESDIGILILMGGAAGFLGLLTSARLIGRFGSRAVVLAAGIALAPALGAMALAPSYAAAAVAFIYLFLCLSIMDVAMNANGADVERDGGRAMMSAFHGFWSFGAMTGSAMGGVLIARFGAGGQTLVAGTIILAVLLAAAPALDRSRAAPGALLGSGLSRDPRVWMLGLLALSAFVAEGAVIDWSSLYLRTELGAGVELSGFAFAGFSLAMMVGRFTGDALRALLGAARLVRLSTLLAAVGFFIAGLGSALPVTVAGFLIAGLGCANIVPVAFSAAGRAAGANAGAGIATATIMGYAGLLTAPATLGHVGEITGFAPIFMAFALVMLGACLLARRVEPD